MQRNKFLAYTWLIHGGRSLEGIKGSSSKLRERFVCRSLGFLFSKQKYAFPPVTCVIKESRYLPNRSQIEKGINAKHFLQASSEDQHLTKNLTLDRQKVKFGHLL